MPSKLILELRLAAVSLIVCSLTATMRIVRASGLPPVMFGDVEDDAVIVLELLFRVDTGEARQLHEELAAEFLDPVGGLVFVVDDEADVMKAGPVRSTLAALGAFREVQQRQIHDPVRQGNGIADRAFNLSDALQFEDAFIK